MRIKSILVRLVALRVFCLVTSWGVLEAAAGIDDALFDCPPEAPDALAVLDVVDAIAVDAANEQVGFEGLIPVAGGDEEDVVVEVVKMPIPKLEVKDDS